MSPIRDRVAMDADEVAGFLAFESKAQVATIGRAGEPHLSTLFYVLDGGLIAFWTYGSSQKVVNLRRDPRLSVLVEAGTAYDELRGVSITGTAVLLDAFDDVRRIGARVAAGLLGLGASADLTEAGEAGAMALAEVDRQARKRVAVIVEPTRIASWDHRKLAG